MLFHTLDFAIFMTVLLGVFAFVRRSQPRKVVLLVASYMFYMWWNPAFIVLLAFVTAVNFLTARQINRCADGPGAKHYLAVNCVVSLGLLAFFKYAGFLEQNVLAVLQAFGVTPSWSMLHVTLPVGISFYTFHTLSYTIDVYRGKMKATEDWLDFAIFASFFPQLVAGPILRAPNFLPGLEKPVKLQMDREILLLCLRGLVKKMVVADNLARVADQVFTDPGRYPSLIIWFATICYSVQIYCDFSGYSDIAIGITRMFGIELPLNFNRPYFARNPADFWSRWHISLSTWLRDYLYIPLGGNRHGELNTYRNLMLTMVLGGLWHGASWNFVLWGSLHGLVLVVHRLHLRLSGKKPRSEGTSRTGYLISWLAMQYMVLVTWITFRVTDTGKMIVALRKFLIPDLDFSLTGVGLGSLPLFSTALLLLLFWSCHTLGFLMDARWEQILARQRLPVAATACFVVGLMLYLLWPLGQAPFIYFQF